MTIDVEFGIELSDTGRLVRPDSRTVAWSEWGPKDGIPLVLVPGTPGSRLSVLWNRNSWEARGVRVIATERPGFGQSSRLANRGFAEHADDVVAILDSLGLTDAIVCGESGAAPHILALLAHHAERFKAASVAVGIAPLSGDEAEQLIGLNKELYRLVEVGDLPGVRSLIELTRSSLLADPLEGIRSIMDTAPAADHNVISDPMWQKGFAVGIREALRPGIDGWVDEWLAFSYPWSDVPLSAISTSLTWWHGDGDRNCPASAARRLVEQIPSAEFRLWSNAGHYTPYLQEAEIFDELLSRWDSRNNLL